MNNTYLLEIGIEEIPARYVKDTLRQLEDKFLKLFKDENISFENIEVYSTPRRLTTIVSGLSEDKKDEVIVKPDNSKDKKDEVIEKPDNSKNNKDEVVIKPNQSEEKEEIDVVSGATE